MSKTSQKDKDVEQAQDRLRDWNRHGIPREQLPGERWGGVEVAAALSWKDENNVLHEVKPSNLQHIRDLPKPVQQIAAGKLWLADEIRVFARIYQARQRARRRAGTPFDQAVA